MSWNCFDKKCRMGRCRAFTMIELLIMLMVVFILLGMLMTGLNRARLSALRTRCAGQLKQIGAGLSLYLDDYRHTLPALEAPVTWHFNINNLYFNNTEVFYCPSHPNSTDAFQDALDTDGLSYGANRDLVAVNYDTITDLTNKILVADNALGIPVSFKNVVRDNNAASPIGNRHSDGANVLFADFHVKWFLQNFLNNDVPDTWWD